MPTGDDHLKAWLSAFLGGDERLQWELTNVESGVTRARSGNDETVEPAPDLGAVTAVTDRRVLFLVGGAGDDGRDHVASVPHEEVAGVDAVAELLTSRLVLTTGAGATWRFTARETDALRDAVAYLDDRMTGADHVDRLLAAAREARDEAESTDETESRTGRYDAAVDAYRRAVALRTAPAVDAAVDPTALREEVLSTVAAGIEAWLDHAREMRSRGNWEIQAGDAATAYRHFSTALDAFERAADLATETPPGDADAIRSERDALLDKLDELDIRTPVITAGDA